MSVTVLKRWPYGVLSYRLQQRPVGYMVLLPELGDELAERNSLLKKNGLPEFDNCTIEKIEMQMEKNVFEMRSGITKIGNFIKTSASRTEDYMRPHFLTQLEQMNTPINITWGIAKTLYLCSKSTMPVKYYMEIHKKATEINCYKFKTATVFENCRKVLNYPKIIEEFYTDEEIQIFRKFHLEGILSGLELKEKKRAKLVNNNRDLECLLNEFGSNVYRNAAEFSYNVKDISLDFKDYPESFLETVLVSWPQKTTKSSNGMDASEQKPLETAALAAAAAATPSVERDSKDVTIGTKTNEALTKSVASIWHIDLKPMVKEGILKYCRDRSLREIVYNSDYLNATGCTNADLNNTKLIDRIRAKRERIADLLLFDNFLLLSSQTKMIENFDYLLKLIERLGAEAKPVQQKELDYLHRFAETDSSFDDFMLKPWDYKYYQEQFGPKEAELCEYFPLDRVLDKFFDFLESLYGIRIEPKRTDVDVWHREDVQYYELLDLRTEHLIGSFYLDAFSRDDDKIRSYMDGCVVQIKSRSGFLNISPLVALIFNFKRLHSKNNRQALLTFADLKVLFFYFGQALQHLFSNVKYSEVAGLSNVEWDAIDFAGNVMKNFLQRPDLVKSLSEHYKTKQPLTDTQVAQLMLKEKLLTATELCDDLYWSSVDLDLYSSRQPWKDIVRKHWSRFYCTPLSDISGLNLCSKTELFMNHMAGHYYKTFWSKMVAADIYDQFENGPDRDVAELFRETFLATGGSCTTREKCFRFMDREPQPDALIRSLDKERSYFKLSF